MQTSCKYFTGYKPCRTMKRNVNQQCIDKCSDYTPVSKRILIIKRGAAGEVLRCTPILRKLKREGTHITWITDFPELLNGEWIDEILTFNYENCEYLKHMQFDRVYSLDKEWGSCVLADNIHVTYEIIGYRLQPYNNFIFGKNSTTREPALYKKGIDDYFMRASITHYVEDLFEICQFDFDDEKYIMPEFKPFKSFNKFAVGLNTGCGEAWKPRKWSKMRWLEVALRLNYIGFTVVLLGGRDEESTNNYLAANSGALFYGSLSKRGFISLIGSLDVVVTAPTFGLHVAIGLDKKTVMLNNTFNKYEFYTYDAAMVRLEPNVSCLACYKSEHDSDCEQANCMDLISAEQVCEAVETLKREGHA